VSGFCRCPHIHGYLWPNQHPYLQTKLFAGVARIDIWIYLCQTLSWVRTQEAHAEATRTQVMHHKKADDSSTVLICNSHYVSDRNTILTVQLSATSLELLV
jgi:hypothetical protein